MHITLIAIILGIVEGLTEFLPVSSTGHLIIAGNLLNFTGEKADCFEIFIQLGAILAVVFLYWDRFKNLLDLKPNQLHEFKGLDACFKLALGCLPAFILGFLLHDFIKKNLFSPLTVSVALIIGGIVMLILEKKVIFKINTTDIDKISYKQSLYIGCFQTLALYPGVSRSAATLIGGMLFGLNRKTAAEFSFILAVPVIFAASAYDLLKSWHFLSAADIFPFTLGLVTSFLVAIVAIKTFIKFLQTKTLEPFGYYRIIVGIIFYIIAVR